MADVYEYELTILQINLHRCKLAHDLLIQYAVENEIDIVAISEPYCIENSWYEDTNRDAAIWVTPAYLKKDNRVLNIFKTKGIVAITIDKAKIFSCYISPNIPKREFQEIIQTLEKEVGRIDTRRTIIVGDFNAKATTWGSGYTDQRGFEILEMSARNDMTPIRSRGKFTFERAGYKSLIDILICGSECASELKSSNILKDYTASDHKYLKHTFEFKDKHKQRNQVTEQYNKVRVDIEVFRNKYQEWTRTTNATNIDAIEDIDDYIRKITKLVSESNIKNHPTYNRKKAVWWWTDKTARARKEVIRARRAYQRARTKQTPNDTVMKLKEDYKDKKKKIKIEINKAKGDKWTEFIESIDKDPWGKPYKWIQNKIRGKASYMGPNNIQAEEAVGKLFITTRQFGQRATEEYTPAGDVDEADAEFKEEEVRKAIKM
ncbi:uncharacterized protein LOC144477815, partial [Augochlora pura]